MGEEELVSVPDAKFTKGEFQVSMLLPSLGPWECCMGWNSWVRLGWVELAFCFPDGRLQLRTA